MRSGLRKAEREKGRESAEAALILNDLGALHSMSGLYREAIPYYRQAAKINRKVLGKNHQMVAMGLDQLPQKRRS